MSSNLQIILAITKKAFIFLHEHADRAASAAPKFDHRREIWSLLYRGIFSLCLMSHWWRKRNCLKQFEVMLRSVKARAIICAAFMHIKPLSMTLCPIDGNMH